MHPWFEAAFCFPLQMTGFEDSRSWAVVVMVTSSSCAGHSSPWGGRLTLLAEVIAKVGKIQLLVG